MSCIRVHHVNTTCLHSQHYVGYTLVIVWLWFGCAKRLISSEEKGISSEVICISSEEKGITSEETAISSEEIRRKTPTQLRIGAHMLTIL